ncbi:MAG: hypothetical protein IID05_02900 [Gemmatimonadetes bacterium]|nr:hypothetical protein [Gemmatimonadota bacterium]
MACSACLRACPVSVVTLAAMMFWMPRNGTVPGERCRREPRRDGRVSGVVGRMDY